MRFFLQIMLSPQVENMSFRKLIFLSNITCTTLVCVTPGIQLGRCSINVEDHMASVSLFMTMLYSLINA